MRGIQAATEARTSYLRIHVGSGLDVPFMRMIGVQDSLEITAKYPKNLVKSILVLSQAQVLLFGDKAIMPDCAFVDDDGHAYKNFKVQPRDNV
uniref:Uncharacterized protein n=1 Tax=Moniliophthora roreri TaxID=221103 RepID=A0A0W0F542_MONRR